MKKEIKRLSDATTKILHLEDVTKKNLYEIARTLEIVHSKELYKDGNFKSTVEYAENAFGYKRQTTQTLIKVASRFLNGSELALEDKDFTVYQMQELLKVDDGVIKEAIESGNLTSNMKTKEIREFAKDVTTPKEEPYPEDSEFEEIKEIPEVKEVQKNMNKILNLIMASREMVSKTETENLDSIVEKLYNASTLIADIKLLVDEQKEDV